MSQYLSVSDFEWMSPEDLACITEARIRSLPPDGNTGYFLEVDLLYHSELHSEHSSYPLAPERIAVKGTQLSAYQRSVLRDQMLKDNSDLSEEQNSAHMSR